MLLKKKLHVYFRINNALRLAGLAGLSIHALDLHAACVDTSIVAADSGSSCIPVAGSYQGQDVVTATGAGSSASFAAPAVNLAVNTDYGYGIKVSSGALVRINGSATVGFAPGISFTRAVDAVGLGSTVLLGGSGIASSGSRATVGLGGRADITSNGDDGFAVRANLAAGEVGDVLIDAASGAKVTTLGGFSGNGLWANHFGLGNANINTAAGFSVRTATSGMGDFSHGLYANSTDVINTGSIAINNAGNVETSGPGGIGIYAWHAGLGTVNVVSTGNVITRGDAAQIEFGSYGILGYIENPDNPSTLNVSTSGRVATAGTEAVGVYALSLSNTGNINIRVRGRVDTTGGTLPNSTGSTAVLALQQYTLQNGSVVGVQGTPGTSGNVSIDAGGTITTQGENSAGIYAMLSSQSGQLRVQSSADISTTGNNAWGIRARANISNDVGFTREAVLLETTGGSISTAGAQAHGLFADVAGYGGLRVKGDSLRITTQGAGAHGVLAEITNPASTAALNVALGSTTPGNINTTGLGAKGVLVRQAGAGAVSLATSGVINSNSDSLVVESAGTGAVFIDNTASLVSSAGNGIDTTLALGINNIVNSGNINAVSAGKFVFAGGGSSNRFTNTAGLLTGNISLGAGADTFDGNGGGLAGELLGGNGNDTVTLRPSFSLAATTLLDGGDGRDSLTLAGQALRGYSSTPIAPLPGLRLLNWETINLTAGTQLTLTGDLNVTASGSSGVFGNVNIDSSSRMNIAGQAGAPVKQSLVGNLSNAGVVFFNNLNTTFQIAGNYTGLPGSVVSLETQLGGDASATDRLHVLGNTTGQTVLQIRNAGGTGAQTVNGIEVVRVNGNSAASSFVLGSPVQAGAYQYFLFQGLPNAASDPAINNDWYLRAQGFRPAVPGYLMAQAVAQEITHGMIGTLHQRVGEAQGLPGSEQNWARLVSQDLSARGQGALGFKQRTSFAQFGRDFSVNTDKSSTPQAVSAEAEERKHSGLSIAFSQSTAAFEDQARRAVAPSTATGGSHIQSLAFGLHHTIYRRSSYLDLTGLLFSQRQSFVDAYNGAASQQSAGLAASVELGQSLTPSGAALKFEPQLQLSYSRTSSKPFNDAVSSIGGVRSQSMRGRLGARLSWNAPRPGAEIPNHSFHLTANLIQEFLMPEAVNIGGTFLNAGANAKRWLDVGLGGQYRLSSSSYVFANIQYQQGLQDGFRQFLASQVGLRARW